MAEADQPLGLTVHSLPSPAEAASGAVQRTRSGRLKMLLVVLICAAPVVASYFTYYVLRPEGRSVFGELIDPQRPLPDLVAQGLDGQPVRLPSLKGQWLLVSVAGGECDAACERNLYLQRQLRESLGKEKDRVDWVWLVNDGVPVREALRPALQSAAVLRVDPAGLAQWLAPAAGQPLSAHLYIVDPMGNWMMRLPPALDAAGAAKAKRDIERLLRASSSWDNAGR
ncbi:hypothetical protein [Pseudorhodoferax sp. Leaf274]|uniref:hypothetical protein n=1 Tax=Pseudorhodoferax sp. Leaf274 TaxID=1736318 RepID=UPI000703433D|nr:hypothetical protein [Pseudorhodoferax sp. Leaf274]KQP39728.1 hypothetical protein ASF44_08345 [Pseudorhodoferax sp. Leaf274]